MILLIFIFCHSIFLAIHFAISKDGLASYEKISKTNLVFCSLAKSDTDSRLATWFQSYKITKEINDGVGLKL